MKYSKLSSIYYQNRELYKKEYDKRFNSISTYHLPLSITRTTGQERAPAKI